MMVNLSRELDETRDHLSYGPRGVFVEEYFA